jgi:hypothetical protein
MTSNPKTCARVAALALTLGVATAPARAHEADWLYFPMYERDTAHAVDLRALKFRPDGLLAAGSRYPRHAYEQWTKEQNERGWYEYESRVIDCETGLWVVTGEALLGQDASVIASKPFDPAEARQSLLRHVTSMSSDKWPSNSEIFLSCAAASKPGFLAQRQKAAKQPLPLISYEPLTAQFMGDSTALAAIGKQPLDFSVYDKRLPATPAALFDDLMRQYTGWQQSFDRSYRPAGSGLNAAWAARMQKAFDAQFREVQGLPDTVRVLPAGRVEFQRQAQLPWGAEPPRQAPKARLATDVLRADCESGIAVPIARVWRDEDDKALWTQPLTAAAALEAVAGRRGGLNDAEAAVWPLRTGPGEGGTTYAICRVVARVAQHLAHAKTGPVPEETDDAVDDPMNTLAALGVDASAFNALSTPESMLLALRAAVRAQRARFNPAYVSNRP